MHKLLLHPASPDRLYQQNHIGVYRSDDRGDSWAAIDRGLPSDFGFGLALNPHDPATCYVTPLRPEGYAFRATDGRLAVYQRTGKAWTARTRGLPGRGAFVSVLREGMASDSLKPCGVYVATGGGHVFASSDAGRTWSPVSLFLPPVLSVSASVV